LITLAGTAVDFGELALVDLAAIASTLQELATRVGRELVDRAGPGRTADVIGGMTRLRLAGISAAVEGGVVLRITQGVPDVLPFDDTLDDRAASFLWEVLEGLSNNERPGWVGPLVAESAVLLNRSFERAATRVTIQREGGVELSWRPKEFVRTTWLGPDHASAVTVTITGMLTAVDLGTNTFRVVDDFGHRVALENVADPQRAAQLIGQRILATGAGVRDRRGDVRHIEAAHVEGPLLPGV
jgi:hypothetical protein